MEDIVILFGSGKIASKVHKRLGKSIQAVIDNDVQKVGTVIWENVPIISIEQYEDEYSTLPIVIAVSKCEEIEKQLIKRNIERYSFAPELWGSDDVTMSNRISHTEWRRYLKELCDKDGMEILEVGSRVVTGTNFRGMFEKANYTGFDYYKGENVDVVGDAHRLSHYFDKKFDLIFSSAVFEHLAMPWQVSLEMIKLLKPGGYVFIETHYSYSSHERPWHFFQYSENALNILFPEKFGIKCIEKGCSNLMEGQFSQAAAPYLRGKRVADLYCHSEFLGQKIEEIPMENLNWLEVSLEDVVGSTQYPKRKE